MFWAHVVIRRADEAQNSRHAQQAKRYSGPSPLTLQKCDNLQFCFTHSCGQLLLVFRQYQLFATHFKPIKYTLKMKFY